jgi:hypothetical protein
MENYRRVEPVAVGGEKMKYRLGMILFFGSLASLFAQTQEAYIREKNGTVELLLSGSGSWRSARAGDPVPAAAVLSTGFKSTAVLSIGNSSITVHPLTRLTIEEILKRDKDEMVNLTLRTGRIRAEVTPPAGGKTEFTVRSPIATASVRGTVFDFDTVNIQVTEGTVVFVPTVQTGGTGSRAVQVSTGDSSAVDQTTGRAVAPLQAAEASRSLPNLAGQASGSDQLPGAGTPAVGVGLSASPGSLNINVILESQ